MYNHAPEGYDYPSCRLAQGKTTSVSTQDDMIYRDDDVTAFMAAGWWPNNRGHVLVVPNGHYENLYDLPPELGAPIQRIVHDVALALKATYDCTCVSTRQHNEPDGNQDVWHYHVRVFPRFPDDNLYVTRRTPSTAESRLPFARKLRKYLDTLHRADTLGGFRSGRSWYGWESEKGRYPFPRRPKGQRLSWRGDDACLKRRSAAVSWNGPPFI